MKIVRTSDYTSNLNFQSAMIQRFGAKFGKPARRFVLFTRESRMQHARVCNQVVAKHPVMRKVRLPVSYRTKIRGILFMDFVAIEGREPVNGLYPIQKIGYRL